MNCGWPAVSGATFSKTGDLLSLAVAADLDSLLGTGIYKEIFTGL